LQGHIYELDKIYLEEDPASTKNSGIDHGRSGSAILQLVWKMKSYDSVPHAVKGVTNYLRTLQKVALNLGVTRPESILKSDVNVSVDTSKRVQIKNVSSFSHIRRAIVLGVKEAPTLQQDATYHYRAGKGGRLQFSRAKGAYPFVRDSEIAPVTIPPLPQAVETYPLLFGKISALPGAHSKTHVLQVTTRLWAKRGTPHYQEQLAHMRDGRTFDQVCTHLDISQIPQSTACLIDSHLRTMESLSTTTLKDILISLKKILAAHRIYMKSNLLQSYVKWFFFPKDTIIRATAIDNKCS